MPGSPIPLHRVVDRRQALRLLAALGASASAVPLLLPRFVAAQGASESGSPAPQPTPQLGPRSEGTTVWRVQVGAESQDFFTETMAFYPDTITVNAGDSIFFDMMGFHTVTFLGGAQRPPVLIPDPSPGTPVATPPAGVPQMILNPEAAFPSSGTSVDGTAIVNSGVPLDPTAPPILFTFPKEGTFTSSCLIHPKMKGTVVVQAKGATPPHSQADYDQMGMQAAQQQLSSVNELAAPYMGTPTASGNTWEVRAGVGNDQALLAKFLPDTLTIKKGDTVRWTHGGGGDPHTVTFLGGGQPPEDTIVKPLSGGPPKVIQSPLTFFKQGGDTFSGTGYHNSGYLKVDPVLVGFSGYQPVDTYELTFDTAGEFDYYCVLHGDPVQKQGMLGKIIVV